MMLRLQGLNFILFPFLFYAQSAQALNLLYPQVDTQIRESEDEEGWEYSNIQLIYSIWHAAL